MLQSLIDPKVKFIGEGEFNYKSSNILPHFWLEI